MTTLSKNQKGIRSFILFGLKFEIKTNQIG